MNWEDLSSNQSYTSNDIEEIRNKLVAFVKSSTDKWTDFNESDLGMQFIELASGIADILNFRLDKQALETYLPTVKQRKNAKALLSLINYKLSGLIPAKTTVRFSLASGVSSPSDIVIPQYFQMSGTTDEGNTIYYVTSKTSTIKAGSLSVDVPAVQGELVTQSYTVSDIMDSSRFYLGTESLAQGSVQVRIDGSDWTEVDDVTKEVDDTETYSIDEDRYDRAYILFHRDFIDMLPDDTSAEVRIRFLNTLAEYGEVKAGTIDRIDDPTTNNNNPLSGLLVVRNIEDSSGSAARESVDHAKVAAPAKLTTVDRLMTLGDYYNTLNSYPGIARAIALDWKTLDYVNDPYVIDCYIVPTELQTLSKAQADDLQEYLDARKVSTMRVNLKSPDYVLINVDAVVYVNATSDQFPSIQKEIEDNIIDFYRPANQDFSDSIATSTLITLIQTTDPLIDYVNLNSPTNQNLKFTQFPKLNTINIELRTSGADN